MTFAKSLCLRALNEKLDIMHLTRKNFSACTLLLLAVLTVYTYGIILLHSLSLSLGHKAMCYGLPSCAMVLRVMKDICRRVPAWGVLNSWVS